MQDFFNITNLKTYQKLSRDDYAKMEKRYIEEQEKKKMNNKSTKTGLNKDNDVCSIQ